MLGYRKSFKSRTCFLPDKDVQKLPLKNEQIFVWWPEQIKNINKISYIPTYEDEMMHKAYQTYRYFPLLKHRGVYFPPSANKDRAVNSIEIKDFIILWTYSQWRQAIVVIQPFLSRCVLSIWMLMHSYGLCPLNHQPYFPILQHCGINNPTKKTGLRGKAKVKQLRLEGGLW